MSFLAERYVCFLYIFTLTGGLSRKTNLPGYLNGAQDMSGKSKQTKLQISLPFFRNTR